VTTLPRLRSLIFLLFLSLSVVLYSIPLGLLGWLLPVTLLHRLGRSWSRANLRALRTICRLDYRVRGLENLPQKNCIAVSNHQSAWETIALRSILPLRQRWVLKRELLWVPFFGWGLAPYRPIAINRSAGRSAGQQLLQQGADSLAAGYWIIVFPEGTRVPPGASHRYNTGSARLAERTQTPIIPIAHNAGLYWPRQPLRKKPGTIEVVIGPPIHPRGRSSTELNEAAKSWIDSTLSELIDPAQGVRPPNNMPTLDVDVLRR